MGRGSKMQLIMALGTGSEEPKTKQLNHINVTLRDLEIIKFILQMKFAKVEDIHKRFFRVKASGTESVTLRSAYRRLRLLEQNGFLTHTRNFLVNEKIYLATPKSFFLLQKNTSDFTSTPYPTKRLDHRTFEHDHLLVKLREVLENHHAVSEWKSDRYIRTAKEFETINHLKIVPDGIFKSRDGQKIAFELELSLKSKSRYRSKIRTIVDYLRMHNLDRAFNKVIFAYASKPVLNALSNEISIYPQYFTLVPLEKLQSLDASI